MAINWLSYVVVIVITTFIVSIITENVVMDRIGLDDGIMVAAGRCRLKKGYGRLSIPNTGNSQALGSHHNSVAYSNSLLVQEEMISELQEDIKTLKYRLEAAEIADQRKKDDYGIY